MRRSEEKEILEKDIKKLKLLSSGMKKILDFYGSERHSINDNRNVNEIHTKNVSETYDDWKYDLFKLSGFVCSKNIHGKECIFEFHSFKENSNSEIYFVQILFKEEGIELGCWKMPLLLDMRNIFAKFPMNDLTNLRSFLLSCKHNLSCQENRQNQFNDLKIYVDSLSNCCVQSNREIHTNVELQMFHVQDLESDNIVNISLYIIYELNEVRPSQLKIYPVYEECLPAEMKPKLIRLFKDFKHLELKSAMEKMVNERIGDEFLWDFDIGNFEENFENEENSPNEETTQDEENKLQDSINNDNSENLQETKSSKKQMIGRKVKSSKQTGKSKSKQITGKNKKISEKVQSLNRTKKTGSQTTLTKIVDSQPKLKKNNTEEINQKLKKSKSENQPKKTEKQIVPKTLVLQKEKSKKKIDKTEENKKSEFENQPEEAEKQTTRPETLDLQTKEPKKKIVDKTKTIKNQAEKTKKQTTLPETLNSQKPKKKNDKTKEIPKSKSENQPEKTGKQTTFTETAKQTENLKKKNTDKTKKNQPVKSNIAIRKPIKRKLQAKESKIKNPEKKSKNKDKPKKMFNLENFVLNRKSQKSTTAETSTGNFLTKNSQISFSSTPIPGPSKTNIEMDSSEISEITPSNKQVLETSSKRRRIISLGDSDSELDQAVEEPDESLLNELKQIEDNVPSVSKRRRKRN